MRKATPKAPKAYVLSDVGQLVTLQGAVKKNGRFIEKDDLGIVPDAAMVVSKGKILWVGEKKSLPNDFKKLKKVSAKGGLVLPGFVDSHTHLVFAGDRSREFEMRLAGKTYSQIAESGGGITATMRATRKATKKELYELAHNRLKNFLRQGVTTVEIKTGYGLDFESEEKCLQVIGLLKKSSPVTVLSTYLAGHAIPPEYQGEKEKYVKVLCEKWLPSLHKLIDYADMFVDAGYFSVEDAQVLLREAKKHKIPLKLHADELKLTGGTEFATREGLLSCDHLLQITRNEIDLLAKSETTATLLPTTAFYLNLGYSPAREMLDRGVRVALATDFNPGTSPTQDVSLVGLLSALKMKMRVEEILVGLTLNGAYALGLQATKGACLPGFDADFLVVDCDNPANLFYEFGQRWNLPKVFCSGVSI